MIPRLQALRLYVDLILTLEEESLWQRSGSLVEEPMIVNRRQRSQIVRSCDDNSKVKVEVEME